MQNRNEMKENPPSLHNEMVARYLDFRKALNLPIARLTPRQGKGIKGIREQLLTMTTDDEERALRGWEYVLTNWQRLPPFLQRQFEPYNIETYLAEMIMVLNPDGKNGKNKTEQARDSREQLRADLTRRGRATGTDAGTEAKRDG